MTPRSATPPPRSSALRRLGPLTVVLGAVLVAGVLASTGRGPATTAGPGAVVGSAAAHLPITYAEATKDGTVGDYDWGDRCDPKTGRMMIPSVYAPPCVAARPGVTGGATYQGVTDTAIKVVLYEAADDDLAALLSSQMDPEKARIQTRKDQLAMLESLLQTWGRRIDVVVLKGRGAGETDARADAVKVATEIKAFASIGGPAQQSAYAEELASRKVLCISCGLSMPDSFYQRFAPYVWGNLQTPEQYLPTLGEITIDQLNNKKAVYAGDPKMHDRTRVFGSVNFEQDPPQFGDVAKEVTAQGKARGYETKVRLTYQLVIPELGEKARAIVGRLKAAGVTTVIFLGDPIMPIYLTQAATDQNFFPEWIITGTVLTDTTAMGRRYDQKQWAHAFGISSLPARVPQTMGESYRLNEWFYGTKPAAPKSAAITYEPIRMFLFGVHMAGPNLTPESFRDGLFAYPPTGGGPTQPQISWGEHGYFAKPDYQAVDDMQLIWWDAAATGPDEQGNEGDGMMRYADGGRRYLPGTMGSDPSWAFRAEGSVVGYPEGDADHPAPDYDPPAGRGN